MFDVDPRRDPLVPQKHTDLALALRFLGQHPLLTDRKVYFSRIVNQTIAISPFDSLLNKTLLNYK
jgi:hypothetical protein